MLSSITTMRNSYNETNFLLVLYFEFVMKYVSEINYDTKIFHFLNISISCLDLFRNAASIYFLGSKNNYTCGATGCAILSDK